MIIRVADNNDIDELAALAYKTFWDAFHDHPKNAPEDLAIYMKKAFSREQIASEISDKGNIFFLAEKASELAGYAKLALGASEAGITALRPAELSRLYSHQKFLGHGVGQMLLEACIAHARQAGCDVMWLGVWEFNPRAQRFYQKNGFRIVGSHIFQLGSDPQTDLLMQREL